MTYRTLAARWALGVLLLAPGFARAGWDNVFQATCFGSKAPSSSYRISASPASPCCPQPQPAYVQRSYYEPVTSYQAVTNYEPVTSYRTSYYYEPVTTMSYSLYTDPCSGCPQQVATPQTSYRLRSKCDAVTNYVARISYKPVTSYRTAYYYEPTVAYSSPAPCCNQPAPVIVPAAPSPAPPTLGESSAPAGGATGAPPTLQDNRSMPPDVPANPSAGRTNRTVPMPPKTQAMPAVRLDRFASHTKSEGNVTGQLLQSDYIPNGGATLQFVSTAGSREAATTDAQGHFSANLPAGTWKLYVGNAFHSTLEIRANEPRNFTVVSR